MQKGNKLDKGTSSRKPVKKRTSRTTKKRTSPKPKKGTSKNKGAGRPSSYKEVVVPMLKKKLKEGQNQIENLGFSGWTDEQMAFQ